MLWHMPDSPGRQCVHGVPDLTQEHLRHLAEPISNYNVHAHEATSYISMQWHLYGGERY